METVSEIIMMPIGDIIPYEKNPRRNSKTVELLVEIIPQVGFNVPLVLDENNVIVKGHARWMAAKKLGMTELPCIISHASDDAIKVDRITDNKIAEFSEWMNEELAEEIDSINLDLSDLGLSRAELEDSIKEDIKSDERGSKTFSGVSGDDSVPDKIPKKYFKCVCKDCGHVMFISVDSVTKGNK